MGEKQRLDWFQDEISSRGESDGENVHGPGREKGRNRGLRLGRNRMMVGMVLE